MFLWGVGMHGVRNQKIGSNETSSQVYGGVWQCFGCGEKGTYVAQCLKASPQVLFFLWGYWTCVITM